MSSHLLMIAIGPVQDFIVQARRTRDLWHGSHLLSELSRCVARTLANEGAELIFPALDKGDKELEYSRGPYRENPAEKSKPQPALNISNIILVEVPEGTKPEELARKAREELFRFWREDIAEPVRSKSGGLLASGIDKVWNEQINSLLEFVAAWDEMDDYKKTRDQLVQAIAARKNLREFDQWQESPRGVPKSSLDGARETVLKRKHESKLFKKYRISDGEQLDAVGVVKRAGGDPDQFPPLVNIALACWTAEAEQKCPKEMQTVRDACEAIGHFPGRNIGRVVRPDLPVVRPFTYDASVFLPNRWVPVLDKELGLQLNMSPEEWGNHHVRPLLEKMNEPYPYVACLVADGDHMGAAIDKLDTIKTHKQFSRKLADFAKKARHIVEQEHRGSLVYAGGDDVLAFLPLPEAVACADALRLKFFDVMKQALPEGTPKNELPTLSAGIGIGYIMESMGELLELGREAEKLAKGSDLKDEKLQRNALALILDKRSGGRRQWRAQWSDRRNGEDHNLLQRLEDDRELLRKELSTRKVYQIAAMQARLPVPRPEEEMSEEEIKEQDKWSPVLVLETKRLFGRAGDGALDLNGVDLKLAEDGSYKDQFDILSGWIDRMLIGRVIANAQPEAKNKAAKEEAA